MTARTTSAASVDISRRLRALREARGWSLRALAQASALTPNALSQIERGNAAPSVSTLNHLAAALGVPVTAFFEVGTSRNAIVHVSADQRTRVTFARGLMEALFISKVEVSPSRAA